MRPKVVIVTALFVMLQSALALSAPRQRHAASPGDPTSGGAQDSAATPAGPTTTPADTVGTTPTTPTTQPSVDPQVARRFGTDVHNRLAALHGPLPTGYHDFIEKQRPNGKEFAVLPLEFGFLTESASQLAQRGDSESLRQFSLNLLVTTHLVRDVPPTQGTDPGGQIQPALLKKLQQLRDDYNKLADSHAAYGGTAGVVAPSGGTAGHVPAFPAAPTTMSPAATNAANAFYDSATALIRAYLIAHPVGATAQTLQGTPVLGKRGKPKLNAQGDPITTGGVLKTLADFKELPSEQHLSGVSIDITRFKLQIRDPKSPDAQLAQQLEALVNPLEKSNLFPHVVPSAEQSTTLRAAKGKKGLTPAPDNILFRGSRVYTVDADGRLTPLADGDYLYENSPLIVHGGQKTIISN